LRTLGGTLGSGRRSYRRSTGFGVDWNGEEGVRDTTQNMLTMKFKYINNLPNSNIMCISANVRALSLLRSESESRGGGTAFGSQGLTGHKSQRIYCTVFGTCVHLCPYPRPRPISTACPQQHAGRINKQADKQTEPVWRPGPSAGHGGA